MINNILSSDDCAHTVDDVWLDIKDRYPDCDRSNPATWNRWPDRSGELLSLQCLQSAACLCAECLSGIGLLHSGVTTYPSCWKNRQNERLHQAYATVLGTRELVVAIDRVCILRPTKGIKWPNSVRAA